MNLPLYLSRRLSLSSGGRKSSPAVRVATAAVALSVAVMIVAVAVVIGFKHEIADRVMGFNSDISITALPSQGSDGEDSSSSLVLLTPSLRDVIMSVPEVEDVAVSSNIPAIFKTKEDFKGVYLKTLSGRDIHRFAASSLEEGRIPDYSSPAADDDILVSRRTADRLGLKVGSVIPTYFMTDRIEVRKLKVVGIYNSHFDDYDDNYGFASPQLVARMGGISDGEGTSVAVSVKDGADLSNVAADIQTALYENLQSGYIYRPYRVSSAYTSGAAYFHWLSMLDMNVWVVIILMTVVACVTLVSGMLIIMVDKVRFIALMSALGSSRRQLSQVFVLLAVRVAAVGLIIGDIIGMALILIQKYFRIAPLDPEAYYIDFVPVEVSWTGFALLNIGVLVVAWIMLILPSSYVGKVSPTRVLVRE